MNAHGVGQANLVPLAALINKFIAIKVNGQLVLLGVGVFARQEVGDIAQIAVKDIAFGIVDQMNDPVALAVLAVGSFKGQFLFLDRIDEILHEIVNLVDTGWPPIHRC